MVSVSLHSLFVRRESERDAEKQREEELPARVLWSKGGNGGKEEKEEG